MTPSGTTRAKRLGYVLFVLAAGSAVATWIMLLIGGTVNPNDASLACEWDASHLVFPRCQGQAFPPMEGGVLYEHGHRLWGWLVGILTVAVCLWALASKAVARKTKHLTLLAVFLVLAQGALGGITVKLGLHPIVSTAHLMLGYGFFAFMIYLTWRLVPERRSAPAAGTRLPRRFLAVAALIVLLQVALGGAIRHFGAGGMCAGDPVGCGAWGFWPSLDLAKLHMSHRLFGYVTAGVVIWAALKARRHALDAGRTQIARVAWVSILLVVAQIALGLATVMAGRVPVIVAFHTAIGGLLVGSVVALFVGFGPLGTPRASDATPRRVMNAGLPLEGAA